MMVVPAANVSKILAISSQVGFDETIPYLLSGYPIYERSKQKKNVIKRAAESTSSSASSKGKRFQ